MTGFFAGLRDMRLGFLVGALAASFSAALGTAGRDEVTFEDVFGAVGFVGVLGARGYVGDLDVLVGDGFGASLLVDASLLIAIFDGR